MKKLDEIDWSTWIPTERAVLSFIRDGDRLMLIHKKSGLGKGKINATGGRIEPGESPLEAAVRESQEETGITPLQPVETGELSFQFTDGYALHGTIFISRKYSGDMIETPEAAPFWCPVDAVPYHQMWADDILWLPHVLEGKYIRGFFVFDDDTMLDQRVEVVY